MVKRFKFHIYHLLSIRLTSIAIWLLCSLLIARFHVPGRLTIAWAEEPKQLEVDNGAEKLLKSSIPESKKVFEAQLPSGIMIELLGVSDNPSDNKPWWRPDGSPLPERPYKSLNKRAYSNQPHIAREFAIYIRNLPSDPVNIQFAIGSDLKSAQYFSAGLFNKLKDNLHAIAVTLPDQPTATIRFGVTEPWQTVAESKQGSSAGLLTSGIEFSDILEKASNVSISISCKILDQETRVIAVGLDGKEHHASSSSNLTFNKIHKINSTFSNILLKDIQVFRLQTRQYKWGEFRNISLQAGQKTNVELIWLDKQPPDFHNSLELW